MRITPATELINRIEQLQRQMDIHSLEAVLILQNADLFYFTGSIQQGALYVPASGDALYMVRKDHGRARMESGLKEVLPFNSPREIPGILGEHGCSLPGRLGMELDVLPVVVMQRFKKPFGDCEVVDATPLIRTVRSTRMVPLCRRSMPNGVSCRISRVCTPSSTK